VRITKDLDENAAAITANTGRLLTARTPWSNTASREIGILAMKMALNERLSVDSRLSFLQAIPYSDGVDQYLKELPLPTREEWARGVGRLFLLTTTSPGIGYACGTPLHWVRRLSPEAASVHAFAVLEASPSSDVRDCIQSEISRWEDRNPPTPEARKRWAFQAPAPGPGQGSVANR
jgi:hypothetical protein